MYWMETTLDTVLTKNSDLVRKIESENIRRVGEVAKLFVDSGQIVITAFISPFEKDRNQVGKIFGEDEFIEVFIDCPLEICEKRDPKGLYKKARKGEIHDFTGIDSPYEPPINPDLTVNTEQHTVRNAANIIISYLKDKQII